MKIAAIEIGSNATKCIIVQRGEKVQYLEGYRTANRLSKGMYNNRCISDEAIKTCLDVLQKYIDYCMEINVKYIKIFATSVLREALNRDILINKALQLFGIQIQVLDGLKESELAFRACSKFVGENDKDFGVIDLGGGSTEIIIGNKRNVISKSSLDIGTVRLTEMFSNNNHSDEDIEDLIHNYIIKILEQSKICLEKNVQVIGTGGTIKAIASIYYGKDYDNPKMVQGLKISKKNIEDVYWMLEGKSIKERQKIQGLDPKRADIIHIGVYSILIILKYLKIEEITMCCEGVLEGFIDEYICEVTN